MSETSIKLLAWSDSASTSTGFGVVSKYILGACQESGKYDIHQLAINYPMRFDNIGKIPWTQIPTRAADPEEPYGKSLFLRTIMEGDYDIVWILNDTYVTYNVAPELKTVINEKRSRGAKVPKVVYYYPIDCHLRREAAAMLEVADEIVAYTQHGVDETLKVMPELKDKLKQIYHGVDTAFYRPLGKEAQTYLKHRYLKHNANKFVILNVNRNSDRKQISRTILAFKEFKKQIPDSMLILHTLPVDKSMGKAIDLYVAVKDLGLSPQEDVLFPKHYEPSHGFPDNTLNEIYNLADCFMTTTLGEGFGLTNLEAMAAGTPVIAPNNTCTPELLGKNSERGFMYKCSDLWYVDNSGFRPFGYLDDIVMEMHKVYRLNVMIPKYENKKLIAATTWAKELDWKIVTRQWLELFDSTLLGKPNTTQVVSLDELPIEGEIL